MQVNGEESKTSLCISVLGAEKNHKANCPDLVNVMM